jgi:glycosyltransferase involved in cell wall biosynthesis
MKNKNPRLSIGLPVYNGERFLVEAIDSILSQSYNDYEFIISDNASTDNTESICRSFAEKDNRICYYRNEKNMGAAWNFNRVVELARGELYKWMADDDLYAPTFLEKCIEALDNHPSVILAYPRSDTIDENGEYLKSLNYEMRVDSDKAWERFRHQIIDPHGCMHIFGVLRTEIFRKTRLLANFVGSDRVLLGLLSLYGKFYEVPEHLFFHREHPRRSVRAYPDLRMRAAWFDPNKKGKRSYPHWKYLAEHTSSIFRAPLDFETRIKCFGQILRWIKWNFNDLMEDLTYTPPKPDKIENQDNAQPTESSSPRQTTKSS